MPCLFLCARHGVDLEHLRDVPHLYFNKQVCRQSILTNYSFHITSFLPCRWLQ